MELLITMSVLEATSRLQRRVEDCKGLFSNTSILTTCTSEEKTIDKELNKYDQSIIIINISPPDKRVSLCTLKTSTSYRVIYSTPPPPKNTLHCINKCIRSEYFKTLNSLKLAQVSSTDALLLRDNVQVFYSSILEESIEATGSFSLKCSFIYPTQST